ncbi:MAG: hypothetical protein K6G81_03535 [Lachnospiraceae bacterium]|nr:hypothetical protein [Lachnospiraceae bacterium]
MKKVLALLLALVMVFSLTACGGAKLSAGSYKLTKMIADGEEQDTDYIQQLAAEGVFFAALVINDDKTAALKMFGEDDEKLTFDGKQFTADNGDKINYTVDGDNITLKDSSTSMIFKKMTDAEKKEFDNPKSDEELTNIMIKVLQDMGALE